MAACVCASSLGPYETVDFSDVSEDDAEHNEVDAAATVWEESPDGRGGSSLAKEGRKNESMNQGAHGGGAEGKGSACRLRGWSVALPEQGSDFSGAGYCARPISA